MQLPACFLAGQLAVPLEEQQVSMEVPTPFWAGFDCNSNLYPRLSTYWCTGGDVEIEICLRSADILCEEVELGMMEGLLCPSASASGPAPAVASATAVQTVRSLVFLPFVVYL